MIARLTAAPAAFLILLAGCSTATGYPSLAPRPIEGVTFDEPEPVAPSPSAAPQDPAVAARLAAAVARAEAGGRAFDAELARAREAAARPGATAVGSEAWVDAQQAATRVDAARQEMSAALADLDTLRLERAQAGATDPAVDSAWSRISEAAGRQDEAYRALVAGLPAQ